MDTADASNFTASPSSPQGKEKENQLRLQIVTPSPCSDGMDWDQGLSLMTLRRNLNIQLSAHIA